MAVPVNVTPGGRNTHHLKATLGATEMGFILCDRNGKPNPLAYFPNPTNPAVQVRTGEQSYQDKSAPWSLKSQKDWSGGRGSVDLDEAQNKYYDGWRINTTKPNDVILSGWDSYGEGIRLGKQYWNGCLPSGKYRTYASVRLSPVSSTWAQKVAIGASEGFTTAYVWLWLYYEGSPGDLTVAIYSDSGGEPNASIVSTTVDPDNLIAYTYNLVRIALSTALSDSTNYWLVFSGGGASVGDFWGIGVSTVDGDTMSKTGAGSWTAQDRTIYYRLTPANDDYKAHFFEYKGALYAALQYHDGGVSKLFMEGDQGVVKGSPSPTTTTCTFDSGTATWAADEAIGSIIKIVSGTGSNQPKPWSIITDNDATSSGETAFTFEAFDVAPAASSEVVIIGSQKWTEIDTTTAPSSGAGWSAGEQVMDVLSVNHAVYFALGDNYVMSRMRRYTSAGVWTTEWNDEGASSQFSKLAWANDQDGAWIFGAKGGYPSQLYKMEAIDCSGTGAKADLSIETGYPINTTDVGKRVNGMCRYGEYGNLHIGKEDGIYQLISDKVIPVGLAHMGVASDERNARTMVVHQGYLYWSYHNTVLRYIDGFLDNVGPTRDEYGLPSDRLGACVAMWSHEDLLIAAFDGGDDNYSSVMVYNNQGWCEWYRSPNTGMRIRNIYVQALPGDNVDRLYFSCGSDLVNMPLSMDPSNHPVPNYYHYYAFAFAGYLVTSWYYLNVMDQEKLFSTYRILSDNLSGSGADPDEQTTIVGEYRIDDDATWTSGVLGWSDYQDTTAFSTTYNVIGRRIQLRLLMSTQNTSMSPRMQVTVLSALIQQDINDYVDVTVLLEDKGQSLIEGIPDSYASASTKLTQLKAWASTAQPPLWNWHASIMDNKYYKIDAPSLKAVQILDNLEGRQRYVVAMRLYEVT